MSPSPKASPIKPPTTAYSAASARSIPVVCSGVAPAALNLISSVTLPRTMTEKEEKSRHAMTTVITEAAIVISRILPRTDSAMLSSVSATPAVTACGLDVIPVK